MVSENDSVVDRGIENLEQIKNGDDPRTDTAVSTEVEKVQTELDRLFEAHEMPDCLDRDDVHAYVADWQRKIGNAKYNTRIESKKHGKRISGREHADGEYSVGVALRAFDSDETWLDTVAHELAHVTAYVIEEYGGHGNSPGHGYGWKQEAKRLGADPTSTDRIAPENQVAPNYHYGCPNGCWTSDKQRRSKKVKNPSRYHCTSCGDDCVSWEHGDERPSDPGTCAVDLS